MNSKNNKFVISVAAAFLFSLLVLLRGPNFDHDYKTYLDLYIEFNPRISELFSGSKEPGYYLLMWFFKTIGARIDDLLFFVSIICLILRFYSVSMFGYLTLVIFIPIYGSSFFLIHELNQTRIAVSTAFFYLIAIDLYEFKETKKIFRRSLWIAPLFHYSSIVLFYAVIKKKISTLLISSLFIFLIGYIAISKINFNDVIYLFSYFSSNDDRAKGYAFEVFNFENDSLRILNGANIAYLFFAAAVRLILSKFNIANNRLFLLNELLIIISIMIFYLFRSSPVVAMRLAELFRIFTPLVLAIVISSLLRKGLFAGAVGCLFGAVSIVLNLILYGPAIYPINEYILFPLGLSRNIGGSL